MNCKAKNARAFTLIELLIVVGIVAVLAAIAVPNFLEAQTRARVARVKADMRSLATVLAAYQVDTNRYPPVAGTFSMGTHERLKPLTTPIAYITTLPEDAFLHGSLISTATPKRDTFLYNTGVAAFGPGSTNLTAPAQMQWSLTSAGPDNVLAFPYYAFASNFVMYNRHVEFIYDPTNGTTSGGEIFRRGGNEPVISGLGVQ